MLCQDGQNDLGYVKFGKSCHVGSRLTSLRTNCPIPARYFAVIELRSEDRQNLAEKDLHEIFAPRKVSGEWFRFDFSSATDKEDFHAGCKAVFGRYASGMDQKNWSFVNVKALNDDAKEVRARILRSGAIVGFNKENERKRRQVNAWKELGSYGA